MSIYTNDRMSQQAFFEILRVAVGTQDTFSRAFSDNEWRDVFSMAKRQYVLGLCYASIQSQEPDMCPSKGICREFLSNAEPIRKRNRIMRHRCMELDRMLGESGFTPCILKGQSLSRYYGELADFRSSGDIDVWVDAPIDRIADFVKDRDVKYRGTYVHLEADLFEDVHVEIHPQPAILRCPWLNRRLQRWIGTFEIDKFDRSEGFAIAPVEFDAVYLLTHMLHHLLFEGVGLRHLMDYAFFLKSADMRARSVQAMETIDSLHMTRFTKGIMWIMREVFGLSDELLLTAPDSRVGRMVLGEILNGGDFGKYDSRNRLGKSDNRVCRAWGGIVRNARFLNLAPEMVVCDPFWRAWHYVWRKEQGFL